MERVVAIATAAAAFGIRRLSAPLVLKAQSAMRPKVPGVRREGWDTLRDPRRATGAGRGRSARRSGADHEEDTLQRTQQRVIRRTMNPVGSSSSPSLSPPARRGLGHDFTFLLFLLHPTPLELLCNRKTTQPPRAMHRFVDQ
ncbi:hypothetical protein EYF80_034429 [Liparis tanakae]|uniref:Uncharacterized protein n=1 Tax=Liparis tanakae TaxID=230148 RepID=A0A4Z2GPG6_9TELE|nr:hypothetical protein EYF80_034429 [Liparis tanakae]